MQAFVITIMDEPKSVKSAEKCIASAKRHGIEVKMHKAITPEDDPESIFENKKLPLDWFKNNEYSRYENCLSAFLSHRSLWEKCLNDRRETLILEHDAYFVDTIYQPLLYNKIISLGQPSYGNYLQPRNLGINPLTSKQYFPGAHAYMMSPAGAKEALEVSKKKPMPTDLFFNIDNFPFLQEYYPWPVEVRETFTTIQKQEGCLAKHMYNEEYEII